MTIEDTSVEGLEREHQKATKRAEDARRAEERARSAHAVAQDEAFAVGQRKTEAMAAREREVMRAHHASFFQVESAALMRLEETRAAFVKAFIDSDLGAAYVAWREADWDLFVLSTSEVGRINALYDEKDRPQAPTPNRPHAWPMSELWDTLLNAGESEARARVDRRERDLRARIAEYAAGRADAMPSLTGDVEN